MRAKGCSPSTTRRTYTILWAVLETPVRDEPLASNPAAKLKRPGVPRVEARCLSIAEVAVLLEAAKDSRHAPLLRLLVAAGLRRGEAPALRWPDVDLTNPVLHVRGTHSWIGGRVQSVVGEPKTERSRRALPLSPTTVGCGRSGSARRSSGSRRARSGLRAVTCSPRRTASRATPPTALRAISTAAKASGMTGVGLHTRRLSAATTMLEAGVPAAHRLTAARARLHRGCALGCRTALGCDAVGENVYVAARVAVWAFRRIRCGLGSSRNRL